MAEDDFLVRYLKIMQNIADTVLHQVDGLEHQFDPAVAPNSMVRLMAEWFAVDWVDSSLPDSLQRQIVMRYSEIIQWRGTKSGLRGLLEVLTGAPARVVDSGGVFAEGESPDGPEIVYIDVDYVGWNRFDDLIRIIESELPATVVFQLTIAGKRVWPRGEGYPTYDSLRYAPMAQTPDVGDRPGTVAGATVAAGSAPRAMGETQEGRNDA